MLRNALPNGEQSLSFMSTVRRDMILELDDRGIFKTYRDIVTVKYCET